MDRSPYRLTYPGIRHPLLSRRLSEEKEKPQRSSTPPLSSENDASPYGIYTSSYIDAPGSRANPIVQPSFGTYASRYGGARSFAISYGSDEDDDAGNDTGAAAWNHVHPLLCNAASSSPISATPNSHIHARTTSSLQQLSPSSPPVFNGLKQKLQKRVSLMLNGPWSPKRQHGLQQNLLRMILPVIIMAIASKFGLLPTSLVGGTRTWDRLGERHLGGRQCVMNLFVDKHEANEYNPDWDLATNMKKAPEPVEGTYRSKGQVEVINRFISSVAVAFRPNIEVQQHIIFAGSRDSGHLAQEALKHWPARGTYRTQLHVFADESPNENLDYETLQGIEDRFQSHHDNIHIYDKNGNVAGHEEENDDDEIDAALRNRKSAESSKTFDELPNMKILIFGGDDDEDTVIPYMHVDGMAMTNQMEILKKAMPLLQDKKVVVVGLEHSPDMHVHELIEFFRDREYKTFMLGLRQLTRIDNLCPEILNNVLMHPSLATNRGWGIDMFGSHNSSDTVPMMPPFFVAMPRGRHSKEEMSIQHMYDLFSGAAGLSQVKTANDRVATVK